MFITIAVFAVAIGTGQSIGELATALSSPDLAVRTRAVMALAEAGPGAKDAVPALARAVGDRNLNVRYWAGSTLKALGPAAAGAVPALVGMLKTFPGGTPELDGPMRYYPDARQVAAEALGAIGPAAKAAVPALKEALKDDSDGVRQAAAAALKAIGG